MTASNIISFPPSTWKVLPVVVFALIWSGPPSPVCELCLWAVIPPEPPPPPPKLKLNSLFGLQYLDQLRTNVRLLVL